MVTGGAFETAEFTRARCTRVIWSQSDEDGEHLQRRVREDGQSVSATIQSLSNIVTAALRLVFVGEIRPTGVLRGRVRMRQLLPEAIIHRRALMKLAEKIWRLKK